MTRLEATLSDSRSRVVTSKIEGNAEKSIRLNGKVQADERQSFTQSSHIPGRIEKLFVNFTGDYISQGQMIAHIYSPDLVTAQEELFEAQMRISICMMKLNFDREKIYDEMFKLAYKDAVLSRRNGVYTNMIFDRIKYTYFRELNCH